MYIIKWKNEYNKINKISLIIVYKNLLMELTNIKRLRGT